MEKFIIPVLAIVFSLAFYFSAHAVGVKKNERWVVYYGDSLPAEQFLPYDMIVFDSQKSPPLRPLQNRGKVILGYLSVAEAEQYRHDYSDIEEMGVMLGENPNWPGHRIIDIRNPLWTKYLIEVKIPEILHKNFNGLMLDTLDSALYLWETDKQKYAGMDVAAVALVATIRKHYPRIKLMVNRGFQVLPQIAPYINYSLAESIVANTQGKDNKVELFPQETTQEVVSILNEAKKRQQYLKIYSLDYWDMEDTEGVKKIYNMQRERGFIPYVTTIDVQQHHHEPDR